MYFKEKSDPNANRLLKKVEVKSPSGFHDETLKYLDRNRGKRGSVPPTSISDTSPERKDKREQQKEARKVETEFKVRTDDNK